MNFKAIMTAVMLLVGGLFCSAVEAQQWEMQAPFPTERHLNAVDFVDANTGWMVGDYVSNGEIWKTTDQGTTWELQYSNSFSSFKDIEMFDADCGWAIGDQIYRTTDGGQSWTAAPLPQGVQGVRMEFFSRTDGFMSTRPSGLTNYLYRLFDGGQSWQYLGEFYVGQWDFADLNVGWAVDLNQRFVRTNDGGLTWQPVPNPAASIDSRVNIAISYDEAIVRTLDQNNIATVHHTYDGGQTWVSSVEGGVNQYSGNFGTVYYTNNGGLSWQDRSLWDFLQHIQDLHIVGTSDAYIIGGYSGASPGTGWLRKTSDTGLTWPFVFDGRYGIQIGMSMVGDDIWTVGYGGTIHHFGSESEVALVTDVEVRTGSLLSGSVNELTGSDDTYVRTRSGFGSTLVDLHHMELAVFAITAIPSPTALNLTIEDHIDQPSGTAQVRLRNWVTGNLDIVGSYTLGPADQVHSFSDIDAANYVSGTGEIEVAIKHLVFKPYLAFTFESFIDDVRVEVR